MSSLEPCRFCDIVDGNYHYDGVDQPFSENEEFAALASIGPLVEGWTLVLPKLHQLSMRNLYPNVEFANFMQSVLPCLTNRYGPLIAFEHGATKQGSITACGTDHAHIHLVPFADSLLPELEKRNMTWVDCRPSEIAKISGEDEYLFYCDLGSQCDWRDPVGYLHVLESPLSQFFRKIIAERIGFVEGADYKYFPHLDLARQTRKALMELVA